MPIPNHAAPTEAQYREYYATLATEDARLNFLKMLKERRDWHRDPIAANLLPELAEVWVHASLRRAQS